MPKPTKGARLGGSAAHEKLLLANLAKSLFEHGRITKIGNRRGDNAPMAVIELVEALTVQQKAVGEAEAATKRAVKEADEAPATEAAAEESKDA